ncbi:hypothetical protein TKK_0018931 [Trichogramma kaykai]
MQHDDSVTRRRSTPPNRSINVQRRALGLVSSAAGVRPLATPRAQRLAGPFIMKVRRVAAQLGKTRSRGIPTAPHSGDLCAAAMHALSPCDSVAWCCRVNC